MSKFFAGVPRKKSKEIFQDQTFPKKFSKRQTFPRIFFSLKEIQKKISARKKGQSGVDKTRLKRMKRTRLERWRYMLDKKKYSWPTYEVSPQQEVKIGYFKLQVESLLNYFFPHLRSRSRKNPPKTKG